MPSHLGSSAARSTERARIHPDGGYRHSLAELALGPSLGCLRPSLLCARSADGWVWATRGPPLLAGMPAYVKLLGPDLGNPLVVEVDPGDTIAQLKNVALANWPSGARSGDRGGGGRARAREAPSAPAPHAARLPAALAPPRQ